MATTIEKVVFSETNVGEPIAITATASPGTTIHESSLFPSQTDEVWIYVVNRHSSAITMSVEYGGMEWNADVPENEGAWLVVPGFLMAPDQTTTVATGTGMLQQGEQKILWYSEDLTGSFSADDWVMINGVTSPFKISTISFTAETPWASSTGYLLGNLSFNNNINYRCTVAHTSSATDEPGVGVNWQDYWEVYPSTITLPGPWPYVSKSFTTISLLAKNAIKMFCATAPATDPVAIGWVNRITRL